MKKILIFLGIFTFSILAFGVNDKDEKEVIVTAEFMAPITIETTNADFGTIIAQSYSKGNFPSTNSGDNGAKNGTLTIKGDGQVFISWKDKNSSGDFEPSWDKLNIKLKKDGDNSGSAPTLDSQFWITDGIKNSIHNIIADEKGTKLNVVGELTNVTSNTPSGTYSGAITIRVSYDDSL